MADKDLRKECERIQNLGMEEYIRQFIEAEEEMAEKLPFELEDPGGIKKNIDTLELMMAAATDEQLIRRIKYDSENMSNGHGRQDLEAYITYMWESRAILAKAFGLSVPSDIPNTQEIAKIASEIWLSQKLKREGQEGMSFEGYKA